MPVPNLEHMLSARSGPLEIGQWLRQHYLPELIRRFNLPAARKRLGLYQGERIPENERNLTDVRNRVSLIVEYELARISNEIIEEHQLPDLFWSYVVANRFPDLEVRRRDGARHLRMEVKCLQSIAEEKAANFDTLKKDIHPHSDFVIAFLWEWGYDGQEFNWDRAPLLLNCFVFHAYSLAELRDHYWLNKPPRNLGGGYQGFDLRYAVNCTQDIYNEEEGNYGKLLRSWQEGFEHRPQDSEILLDTETEYLRFKKEVVMAGFRNLAARHLPALSQQPNVTSIATNTGVEIGRQAGEFGFFAKNMAEKNEILEAMRRNNLRFAIVLTDKYVCTGSELVNGKLLQRFSGLKPKRLARTEFGLA